METKLQPAQCNVVKDVLVWGLCNGRCLHPVGSLLVGSRWETMPCTEQQTSLQGWGVNRQRVKYHCKEEVKAQACEYITRRTIYAQARVQFDMGIMKKRRSLWMT